MKLNETSQPPKSKLDVDNKAYIVYDTNGVEVSRHTFKHIWDSSPAMRAAVAEVQLLRADYRKAQAEQKAKAAEAKPLSAVEQEYIEINRKWQRYYDIMFPPDKSPSILDAETADVYSKQMDKWMARLHQLNQSVRKSVITGTYKPQ